MKKMKQLICSALILIISSYSVAAITYPYLLVYKPFKSKHKSIEVGTVDITYHVKKKTSGNNSPSMPYSMIMKLKLKEEGVQEVKEHYWKGFNLGLCLFRRFSLNPEELIWQYSYFDSISRSSAEQSFYVISRYHQKPDRLYHHLEAKAGCSYELSTVEEMLRKASIEVPSIESFGLTPKSENLQPERYEIFFESLTRIRIPWLALATISLEQIQNLLSLPELSMNGVSWLVPDQRYLSGYSQVLRNGEREILSCCVGEATFKIPVTTLSTDKGLMIAHASLPPNEAVTIPPVSFSYPVYDGLLIYTIAASNILQQIAATEEEQQAPPSSPLSQPPSQQPSSLSETTESSTGKGGIPLSSSAPAQTHMRLVPHAYEDTEIKIQNGSSSVTTPSPLASPKEVEGGVFKLED